ncbi:MAG: TolC family protein [Candidatus Omnitrophota bacterium]
MKKISLFFIIFLLASSAAAYDEKQREIEKALFVTAGAEDRVLKIGLVDCIAYALKNNSEIKVERISPQLKKDDVKIAYGTFEPSFTTELTLADNTEVASSRLQGAGKYNTQDINLNAGISGKLVTGTEYSLDFLNQKYKSDSTYQIYNPYYTAEPKITITQPLFKGAGVLVNKADILIARNNEMQSEESFKDTAISTISKVKNTYYKYVFFVEAYAIEELALERIMKLLEINKARYAKGLASSVDILETEAEVAQKQKIILTAESEMKKAEDELKLVTNLVDDPEVWNARIELIDKPQFVIVDANLVKSVGLAFDNRPDYKSAKIDLENRDIKIKAAKNALLPTFDLNGSLGLNGLGADYGKALQKVSPDYPDWSVGVKFSVPWGEADRAKYNQRQLEKLQTLIAFKRLEQNIIFDVRDRVREVNIQARQVEVSKLYQDKEGENFRAQKERYAEGQVSTHDMLDYQDKLSRAQLSYLKALVEYNVALISLDKSEGLTLVKNDVKLSLASD